MDEWDVVIAGAGPAGSLAAYCLARKGARVLLVDETRKTSPTIGDSLPGAARPLLRDLGLLSILTEGGHLSSTGTTSAWGGEQTVTSDTLLDPHGAGWRLNRNRFDADLEAAALHAGAHRRTARVIGAARNDGTWKIELTEGTATAKWLIDATGRRASVARRLGAQRHRDAPLMAVCVWLASNGAQATEVDHEQRAFVEAVPEGWWYAARLPGNIRTVLFHTDPVHTVSPLDAVKWQTAVARTNHIQRFVSGAQPVEPLRGTEACGAWTEPYMGDGWLTAGDAAMSFDPISSQGIFNALYTGMAAANAVETSLGGSTTAGAEYTDRLRSIRQAYLRHRHSYYAAESRWPDQPFWRTQHDCDPMQK